MHKLVLVLEDRFLARTLICPLPHSCCLLAKSAHSVLKTVDESMDYGDRLPGFKSQLYLTTECELSALMGGQGGAVTVLCKGTGAPSSQDGSEDSIYTCV